MCDVVGEILQSWKGLEGLRIIVKTQLVQRTCEYSFGYSNSPKIRKSGVAMLVIGGQPKVNFKVVLVKMSF